MNFICIHLKSLLNTFFSYKFINWLRLYFSVTTNIIITNAQVRFVDLDKTTVVSPDDINLPRSVPKKWTNNRRLDKLTFTLGAIYKVNATIPKFGKYEEDGTNFSHFVTNFSYGIISGTIQAHFKRGKL